MKKALLLLTIITITFAACKKGGSGNISPKDRLISLLLGKDTLDMYVGETRQVPLTINPTSYHLDSLLWKSSDTAVLSFSNTGLLTAKKIGSSTITVSNLTNTISISALVTVGPAPIDSLSLGLIAYYPFNNSAADMSGNNNNGTAFNVTATADRNNVANAAYYFNGTNSYITVKDNQALRLNNTDFTINMWVNLDSYINDSGTALLSKNSGAGQMGWNCSIVGYDNSNGAIPGNIFYNVSGGSDPYAFGTAKVDSTQWTMITITYTNASQTITFYKNGVFDKAVQGIPTPNSQTNAILHIGNNSLLDIQPTAHPYALKGKMDDIRIYNRQLNITDIGKLYVRTN
jgi:hypothetical protein